MPQPETRPSQRSHAAEKRRNAEHLPYCNPPPEEAVREALTNFRGIPALNKERARWQHARAAAAQLLALWAVGLGANEVRFFAHHGPNELGMLVTPESHFFDMRAAFFHGVGYMWEMRHGDGARSHAPDADMVRALSGRALGTLYLLAEVFIDDMEAEIRHTALWLLALSSGTGRVEKRVLADMRASIGPKLSPTYLQDVMAAQKYAERSIWD